MLYFLLFFFFCAVSIGFCRIEEHNKSGAGWTMAVNQFSDLTEVGTK